RRQRKQLATSLSYETGEVLAELTPEDVFAKRLAQETLTDEQITTLKGLHAQVLEALQEAD
ncbi:MAG: exonuclease subunit SbcD, partial [Pseudomonadaceae bacterium]|nr:exonuclease subunit SbcD [Pseudomonadaceae bacterium]